MSGWAQMTTIQREWVPIKEVMRRYKLSLYKVRRIIQQNNLETRRDQRDMRQTLVSVTDVQAILEPKRE